MSPVPVPATASRPRRARRAVALVAAVGLSLALAACGDDHDSRDVDSLEGSWVLTEFDEADVPVDPTVETTLVLADGEASGNSGVNEFSGSYQAEDGKVTFSRLTGTTETGSEAALRQEQRFLDAMADVENFEYDSEDDELELKDGRDETLLVFRSR